MNPASRRQLAGATLDAILKLSPARFTHESLQNTRVGLGQVHHDLPIGNIREMTIDVEMDEFGV